MSIKPSSILNFKKKSLKPSYEVILFELMFIFKFKFLLLNIPVFNSPVKIEFELNTLWISNLSILLSIFKKKGL